MCFCLRTPTEGKSFRRAKGRGRTGEVTHYRENRHERHYSAAELLLDPEMRPLARGTGASKPVFSFVKVLFDRVRTYVRIRARLDLTLCSVKCTPILLRSLDMYTVYVYDRNSHQKSCVSSNVFPRH